MQHMEQKHGRQVQTVWSSCAGFVARPLLPVGPSGRSGVAGSTAAGAALLSVNFALGTPCWTDDGLGNRTRRAAVWQPVSNSLRAMCGLSLRHGLGRESRRSHELSLPLSLAQHVWESGKSVT